MAHRKDQDNNGPEKTPKPEKDSKMGTHQRKGTSRPYLTVIEGAKKTKSSEAESGNECLSAQKQGITTEGRSTYEERAEGEISFTAWKAEPNAIRAWISIISLMGRLLKLFFGIIVFSVEYEVRWVAERVRHVAWRCSEGLRSSSRDRTD